MAWGSISRTNGVKGKIKAIRVNLLHRHLFWSVLTTCLVAVGMFVFVLIVGNALRDLLGYLLAGQLEPMAFVKLLSLLVPYVAAFALPIGVLTGVLLVLGRMSGNSEVTAMRAAGLSLGYIARPVFIFAILGTVVAMGINYYYMPLARTAYRETLVEAVRQNPLNFLVPRTFVRDFPGVVVYAGEVAGTELSDFWLWQMDGEQRVKRLVQAQAGDIRYVEEENKLVLTLRRVTVETRDEKDPEDFSRPLPLGYSEELAVDLGLEKILGAPTVRRKLTWMTLGQLLEIRRELAAEAPPGEERARKLARMRVQVVLNEKAASACAVLAFALIGVPLGIKVSRKETSANLGVALVLVLGYYFLAGVSGWLEAYPSLRPDLLTWMPVLLFGGIGIVLFNRIGR